MKDVLAGFLGSLLLWILLLKIFSLVECPNGFNATTWWYECIKEENINDKQDK